MFLKVREYVISYMNGLCVKIHHRLCAHQHDKNSKGSSRKFRKSEKTPNFTNLANNRVLNGNGSLITGVNLMVRFAQKPRFT